MTPEVRYVDHLPDLMTWDDYAAADRKRTVRVRLVVTADGRLEVLGDSPYPDVLERLLAGLGPKVIEQMLCG